MGYIRSLKKRLGYYFFIKLHPLIWLQKRDPLSIPIIIVNFNQLFYLKQLVNFLLERKFSRIIIIDNKSDYPPLLHYYSEISDKVIIEKMDANYGHMVFFENRKLWKKYGRGYYVVTDADIVPNINCPENFMRTFIKLLDKNHMRITKVGFALRIDDLPEAYTLKQKVLDWEAQFWKKEITTNIYEAYLDTTFALYKPRYPKRFGNNHKTPIEFYFAFRIAGDCIAKHGGWYVDFKNPTSENLHYRKTASISSSWNVDDNGELMGIHKDRENRNAT